MKKLSYLIVLSLILGLVLTGCSLLSNIRQAPATDQSVVTYLTKGLPSGLVGLWSFEKGEELSTAYDSSGNNNDGTIYGADYIPDQWGGYALSFNGTDDYVDCGDISTANLANLTTEAWVYWDGTVRQGYAGVYCKAYGSDIGRLLINGAGMILVQNGNGNFFSDNIGDVPVNEWCHIAYVYDQVAGKEYVYVNGDQKGEQNRTGDIIQNSNSFCIGYGWMGATYYIFSGLIDEVRIYDYALSLPTIENHAAGIYGFNGLLSPYVAPPKAFKAGRSIPLKWQYSNNLGNEVDSSEADPSVTVIFKGTIEDPVDDVTIVVEDPGASGYLYDSDTKTWQFNWQTKNCVPGEYEIWISSNLTGQVNGPFPIHLR